MRIRGFICIAVGLILTAAAARAEEVTVVSDVLGPEGPLFMDGNLYYVAWTSGTLSKWDGKTTTVLNSLPGCKKPSMPPGPSSRPTEPTRRPQCPTPNRSAPRNPPIGSR